MGGFLEEGANLRRSKPAVCVGVEASQQTAELSEVLALRMENYEQQWREVAQLQGRVMKLQRCSRSYGAETETLQKQLGLEKEIQMKLQDELQDLQGKCSECGDMLMEAQEEVKTLHQQAPASAGSVTHYTYTVPLELGSDSRGDIRPGAYPQRGGIWLTPRISIPSLSLDSDKAGGISSFVDAPEDLRASCIAAQT
ncbi:hypothetical protein MG293_016598 [Ovis ammon polii]|uniref:HAP1 N-terminal domain-containing protein n=1 Tax=Ovis ammon polii TaxID=230172 RepID=A0AAD4TWD2_OVIAM|nr:hypothetical protein MG293_016598 [Ovis ammon polii]